MSCCNTSKNNCCQGRNCPIQKQVAEDRSERIQAWFLRNQSLISNSSLGIVALMFAGLWAIK